MWLIISEVSMTRLRTWVVTALVVNGVLLLYSVKVWQGRPPTHSIEDSSLREGNEPQVRLHSGLVSGMWDRAQKGRIYYSFLGIPYAKPPLGLLRFKDPVPAEPWQGVRDGTKYPSCCPSVPVGVQRHGNRGIQGQEDCLYINVFTPPLQKSQKKLPVMVYIHGGSFLAGGAKHYQPLPLLQQDLVLVTLQYRLGVLGFLSTEDEVLPGNLGLKDQTLALTWVRDNIGHFGGDSKRVTIFGGSAGGASVQLLMFNPHAEGLFSRAIMQSGSALSPWAVRTGHRAVAYTVGGRLGCPTPDPISNNSLRDNERLVDCLQKAPLDALVPSFMDFSVWATLPWVTVPRVDGDYLPEDPAILLREGKFHKVPLITGVTQHDGLLITGNLYNTPSLREQLVKNFVNVGPGAALLLGEGDEQPLTLARLAFHHYLGGIKAGDHDKVTLTQLFGDRLFTVAHDETWRFTSQHQDLPVYTYELKPSNTTGKKCETGGGAAFLTLRYLEVV
ncbi:juvenile hormone esterase-like isoform X1 [Homarus americanus]|uniref:juvenile hormone esterase-like isoform X1 n=2 Tax=Homarus americanus TaxID=6706 RepID=UPI001C4721C8|nr:juvenile hormone esterase-like isoform X1 [Homarus americanus]